MVATWPSWLSGKSLPLTMKYSRYVHYIICHGKQDAKVIIVWYNNQFSTKSVKLAARSIKENLWKHLDGSKFANCIPAGRLSEQCREQRFLTNHLTPDWVDVQQAKLGAVPTVIFFALGCVGCTKCCCGKWQRLAGGSNCHGPFRCSIYMLRHSNSNTTVFDITRYQIR